MLGKHPPRTGAFRRPRDPSEGERLLPASELHELWLQAYYDVLNKDAPFRLALSHTFRAWQRLGHQKGSRAAERESILTEFIQSWPLPQTSARRDILASFWFAQRARHGWVLRLTIDSAVQELPDIGSAVPDARAIVGLPPGVSRAPVITPTVLPPFVYDPRRPEPPWARTFLGHPTEPGMTPTRGDPHWVRHYADEVAGQLRQSILDQAQAFEEEAARLRPGWDRVPPRHRNQQDVIRMATRLYQHVMLGWDWAQIADSETNTGRGFVRTDTVRSSVTRWVDELKIPLAHRGAR